MTASASPGEDLLCVRYTAPSGWRYVTLIDYSGISATIDRVARRSLMIDGIIVAVALVLSVERAIPISSEMRAHVSGNLDEVGQQVAAFIEYASQPGNASPLMNPDPTVHSQVADLLGQYSEQVRYEVISDLAGAAQQFMDEANAILAAAQTAE